jgi:hypothetical protein
VTQSKKALAMKRSSVICATVGALALAGIAAMPAQARGFGPGLAGALVGGAIVAGAASSAYAYGPDPGYYDSYAYDAGPGYYGAPYSRRYNGNTYGGYDESQHGGQPSYSRPF